MELNPEALATIRVLAGFSQAELARQTKLSQGHISELEKGAKKARPATIKKLADALNVPIASLMTVRSEPVAS